MSLQCLHAYVKSTCVVSRVCSNCYDWLNSIEAFMRCVSKVLDYPCAVIICGMEKAERA
jgi:hypothetical protein